MDDPPTRVTQYTVRELSYRKHKNWEKIEDQCQTSFLVGLRRRCLAVLAASDGHTSTLGIQPCLNFYP